MHFTHMPKTGGTWVTRRVLGIDSVRHRRAVEEPRPSWGILRDPWSWYASMYLHATRPGVDRRSQLRQWGGGATDFRSCLYGWTHPTAERIPDKRPAVLLDHPPRRRLDTSTGGLWTWLVRWYFGDDKGGWAVDALADHHRLYEALCALGHEVTPDQHPPENTCRQGAHPEWDDEMRAWVAEADADLIDRFGLQPYGGLAEPVVHL